MEMSIGWFSLHWCYSRLRLLSGCHQLMWFLMLVMLRIYLVLEWWTLLITWVISSCHFCWRQHTKFSQVFAFKLFAFVTGFRCCFPLASHVFCTILYPLPTIILMSYFKQVLEYIPSRSSFSPTASRHGSSHSHLASPNCSWNHSCPWQVITHFWRRIKIKKKKTTAEINSWIKCIWHYRHFPPLF